MADVTLTKELAVNSQSRSDNAQEFAIIDLNTFLAKDGVADHLPHRANSYQLLLITHGEGTHWVNLEPLPYQRGALFAIEKSQIQVYDFKPGTEGYLILFTEEYLYRYPSDLEWLFSLALFNPYFAPPVLYLSSAECDEFLALVKSMQAELAINPDFIKNDILRNLLKVFVLKAERIKRGQCNLVTPQDAHNHKDYSMFVQFRNALEADYASSRGVQDYASALAVTPKKLNKVTHLYLGKPPKQIIDERVVLEIKRLILYSELTIQEIAYATGFSDPANMTKFFKRYTKITPARFKSLCK